MKNESNHKEIMDVEQVADYLGLAVGTIYQKVFHKEIPFIKAKGVLRFRKSYIDAWLDKHSVQPKSSSD